MKKNIYWSSIGYLMLSLVLSIFFGALSTILLIFRDEAPVVAVCFSIVLFLFCVFCVFLSFNHRVTIDLNKKTLIFCSLKHKEINIGNIKAIEIDTANSIDKDKYCFVWIRLFDGEDYRWSEYSCLLKNKAVAITKQKIEIINEYLFHEINVDLLHSNIVGIDKET